MPVPVPVPVPVPLPPETITIRLPLRDRIRLREMAEAEDVAVESAILYLLADALVRREMNLERELQDLARAAPPRKRRPGRAALRPIAPAEDGAPDQSR